MHITFVLSAIFAIINTMQGASGQPETTKDDMFRTSESTFFDRKEQYDWEDDFYESFKNKNQDSKRKTGDNNLWIDWSTNEDGFVEILETEETENFEDADMSADESDVSFYTAKS